MGWQPRLQTLIKKKTNFGRYHDRRRKNNVDGWNYDRKAERVANPENRCVSVASVTKNFIKRQKKKIHGNRLYDMFHSSMQPFILLINKLKVHITVQRKMLTILHNLL